MNQVVQLHATPECTAAHDRKIFVNMTNRSNYRTPFISNSSGVVRNMHARFEEEREPTVGEVLDAIGNPSFWDEVVFAGVGEPTLRLYDLLETARRIHERGGSVRLETDGLANLVYGREVTPDLEGNVDALLVTLNGHDAESHERTCGAGLAGAFDAALEFALGATQFVESVALTVVAEVDGIDMAACRRLARRLRLPLLVLPYLCADR